jgi:5'-3' exonuclease
MQYLIDASVYVFRAYYSMPEDMVDDAGNPINAFYGFCRFIGDFMEQVTPEYVAVLFDESLSKSFRTEIFPEYKANREPAPPELKRQFGQCRRYVRALGIMEHASPRYEADDLIGTLVEHGRRQGRPSTIVTRDKDLTQLLSKDDVFWDFAGKGKLGYEQIPGSFGVWPEQIADFLALAGDAVDNIKGVPGVRARGKCSRREDTGCETGDPPGRCHAGTSADGNCLRCTDRRPGDRATAFCAKARGNQCAFR